MNVLFIYLPHPFLVDPEAQPPIGLLYLASILKQNNILVDLRNYSSFTVEEAIADLPEADIYGITCTSLELMDANEFGAKIKEKYSNAKVIVGGPGTISDEYVDFNIIDSICKGEGELTILKMIKDVEYGKLEKIYLGQRVMDLDTIPFPDRSLLDKQGGYIFANHKTYDKTFSMPFKGKGTTAILTSRGCPWNCFFCAAKAVNPNLRFRSPENVYAEFVEVLDKYKIKQIRISDEMFTAKRAHAERICELIKPLGVVWRISARVKPLTLELLKIMRKAGCVEISFGIESFDDDVLKGLNKGTTALDNMRAIQLAKQAGMMVRILFMIRTPFQTKDTVRKNIEYIKKVDYDTIACTSFVPLPGTPIFNEPDRFNIEILNKNLRDYNFYFFGSAGKNELRNIIRIKDRSLEEFNAESEYFRDWIEEYGKINRG